MPHSHITADPWHKEDDIRGLVRKFAEKVLLNRIAFMDYNENSHSLQVLENVTSDPLARGAVVTSLRWTKVIYITGMSTGAQVRSGA